MEELVSINGTVFKPEEAKISVFDRGYLYGDGIYEVARGYGGIFFSLEEHLVRLFRSAERIGLDIGFDQKQLQDEIYRVYRHSTITDSYMRIVITRGEGAISLDPAAAPKPNTVIFVRHREKLDPAVYEKGVSIVISSILRNSKKALDPNIKSGNYLNNILALAEAKKKKTSDAVMVNKDGYITEGTTSNIYFVKNKTVVTPPDDADILHGITRHHLRQICKTHGISWSEKFFTPDELFASDEVFTSGTVKEIVPVCSIDGKTIGVGVPGPVTTRLANLYKEHVAHYCKNFKGNR